MEFRYSEAGSYYWTSAPDFAGLGKDRVTIAASTGSLQNRVSRGVRTQLGQFYGVIATGAINAVAAHKGLKRSMLVGDDQDAHEEKYVLVLNPPHDACLVGDRFEPRTSKIDPPPQQVFVIYLTPNKKRADFPDVDYWIEHWTWVDADATDPRQPFGFQERYDEPCVWERP
ncbi:hypothetical protein PVW48_03655 [Dinoroseobacter sp. PD6]|uniref:hypothetical protein n=1 Tax=Dinoroseobacter sp. PD6 TaxID=3028384 RepID=UPI00237A4193|nr:hypothetical protein [Dinoroseobacter sp. PD6]MDD9715822.1 hypothetical protein [Dinoroseobacter sp. PD6]